MKFELINGTGDPAASFPVCLARWLTRRTELIGAIVELRHTGHAPDAVDALLALPDVEQIRTAWLDWLSVVDDADRAATLLLAEVRANALANVIHALWAIPVRTGHRPSRRRRIFCRRLTCD